MPRKRIEMILEIHAASAKPLYAVLHEIPQAQFLWKPAPESRSINEIMCHLIRVDNSFLKRLGVSPQATDPKNGNPIDVLAELKNVHSQISSVVSSSLDDSDLFLQSKIPSAKKTDTINEHILHSCQHNLYHLSQMIYLRRVLDRSWKSPIDDWDKATRIIANYLSF